MPPIDEKTEKMSNGNTIERISDDFNVMWQGIAQDLNLDVDPEYATKAGELIVEFPSTRLRMGSKMKMADCRNPPVKIKCQALAAQQEDLYLILMVNLDVPSMEKPLQRCWLHWMLVNVKGFQLDTGRVLCKYGPPNPSANSGTHRFCFLMFKQEEQLDQVAAYEDARRGKFNVEEFAKRYHLGKPVAMSYFMAERPGARRGSLAKTGSRSDLKTGLKNMNLN